MPYRAPAFQFYAADWLTGSNARAMLVQQRGLYIDLLAQQWINKSIPSDVEGIARVVGLPEALVKELWAGPLKACFVALPGDPHRLINERLEAQRRDQEAYHDRRVKAGQKGAKSKAQVMLKQSSSVAQASLKPSSSSSSSSSNNNTLPNGSEGRSTWARGPAAAALRQYCYPPDGLPPSEADIGSDLRWFKYRLVVRGDSFERVLAALKGATTAEIGLAGTKWSPAKMFSKHGPWSDLFERAITAGGRQRTPDNGPSPIAKVLRDAIAKASPTPSD